MGELPARKRGLTLKQGTALPETPRFKKSPMEPQHKIEPTTRTNTEAPPIRVTIRVGFFDDMQTLAIQCVEKFGGNLNQLTTAIFREMTITDHDFSQAGAPRPRERLSNLSVQVNCKIEQELYAKWAKKLDPFNIMKPGDIVRGAANTAFNRTAKSILKELNA